MSHFRHLSFWVPDVKLDTQKSRHTKPLVALLSKQSRTLFTRESQSFKCPLSKFMSQLEQGPTFLYLPRIGFRRETDSLILCCLEPECYLLVNKLQGASENTHGWKIVLVIMPQSVRTWYICHNLGSFSR